MMSFWKRFSYNRGAVIGLVILTFVIAAAILAARALHLEPRGLRGGRGRGRRRPRSTNSGRRGRTLAVTPGQSIFFVE